MTESLLHPPILPTTPSQLRAQTGLTQYEFWKRIGVTQSTGCRYEKSRSMPVSVQLLLKLVYVDNIPVTRLKGTDMAIAAILREHYPELYGNLLEGAKKKG